VAHVRDETRSVSPISRGRLPRSRCLILRYLYYVLPSYDVVSLALHPIQIIIQLLPRVYNFKMDDMKEPRVYIHQLPSQSSFGTTKPLQSSQNISHPDLWPSQPQVLKETKLAKWLNILYDAALCIAPVLLMMKIGLVIYQYKVDNSGTTWLANLNDQASSTFLEKEGKF
jgi:hypothetical protein